MDAELETLLGVLDGIQVRPRRPRHQNITFIPLASRQMPPLAPLAGLRRRMLNSFIPYSQTAVGGKAEKKAKEGGKVDKFMDLKQTMIGALTWEVGGREGGERKCPEEVSM